MKMYLYLHLYFEASYAMLCSTIPDSGRTYKLIKMSQIRSSSRTNPTPSHPAWKSVRMSLLFPPPLLSTHPSNHLLLLLQSTLGSNKTPHLLRPTRPRRRLSRRAAARRPATKNQWKRVDGRGGYERGGVGVGEE